jgi:ankyrin repeat protein
LHHCSRYDNTELLEFFLNERIRLDFIKKESFVEKQTALHYAAKYGSCETMSFYQKIMSDFMERIEDVDTHGRNCLFLAAEYGNSKIVQILVDLGCEINITNLHGQKALYWIIAKNSEIVINEE